MLASSLPGVQLLPFHVKEAGLPAFTADQWRELLQKPSNSIHTPGNSSSSSSASAGDHGSSSSGWQPRNAAILLSAPHFVDVEKFLLRMSAALPGMPVG